MTAAARDPHSIPADATTIATTETPDGTFIADGEISQLFERRAQAVTAADVLDRGDPDEPLDVAEAAAQLASYAAVRATALPPKRDG